jgi:hypothetical protein
MLFVFIYAYWCWCHLTVTRTITIVDQELHTLRSSWGLPFCICLSGVPCCSILSNFMFSFPLRISHKTLFCPSLLLFVLWEVHVLFMFFVFINAYILVSNTISMHTGFQHDFPDIWCWCHLTVTRRVTIVGQELLTLPEHLRPPPGFLWGSCCPIVSFLCSVL